MADRQQLHLPRRARLRRSPPTRTRSSRSYETGLGLLRARDMRVLRRGGQLVAVTPEIRAFLDEPQLLDRHQVGACARACTGAPTWTMSASSGSTPTASSPASSASSACSPRPPIRRSTAHDPLSAPQGRRPWSSAPASIRTAIPARRWSTCWRPIRATSCSRSTRTRSITSRWRSCSSTSGRACACCRGATASTASSRCSSYVPRDRYDSDVRKAIGDYLAEVYQGPRQRLLSVLSGRAAGARALHHRPARRRRRPIPTAPTLEDAVAGIVRTWTDGARRRRSPRRTSRQRARALFERYRDAFSQGYREAYSPLVAVDDIRVIERPVAGAPAERRLPSPRRTTKATASGSRSGAAPPDPAVGARAGAGEHGLPRGRRAHLPDRASARPRSPTSGSTTWRSSAPTAARSISTRVKQRARSTASSS